MAGTVQANVNVTTSSSDQTFRHNYTRNKTITQNAIGIHDTVVSVGTTEENITVGDIATEGYLTLENLDATNFVQWGASATTPTMATIGRLKPGEPAAFRMEAGTTLRVKADTAACKVRITLRED